LQIAWKLVFPSLRIPQWLCHALRIANIMKAWAIFDAGEVAVGGDQRKLYKSLQI
jgi:hypothetical protein